MESALNAAPLLLLLVGQAVALGHLREAPDVEQFGWELFDICLSA